MALSKTQQQRLAVLRKMAATYRDVGQDHLAARVEAQAEALERKLEEKE